MNTIQSLWIGRELSAMECLCLYSFRKHGHAFRLYTYEPVSGVPAGVEIRDAQEILPSSAIFRYPNGSFAGFANAFRYKLLLQNGGWWVDLDTVCLKPFDFPGEHVFGGQRDREGDITVWNGVIKAPAGSRFCEYAWEVCQTKDPKQLVWGETGPLLTTQAVRDLGLQNCVLGPETFCPVDAYRFETMLDPNVIHEFGEATYAVHLWHELWRRKSIDKNASFAPACLYERLKSAFLPAVPKRNE